MKPHQSTEMALERTASHINMTHLPCLFQLLPWENVNRSTTVCEWCHLINYSWEMMRFPQCCASYLKNTRCNYSDSRTAKSRISR